MWVRLCSITGVVDTHHVHSLFHSILQTPSHTCLPVWHWNNFLLVWPGYSYFSASNDREGGSHSRHLPSTPCINTQLCVSQTQQNRIMFIIILWQHSGESNGKLPPRTCPGCSVSEPYRSHEGSGSYQARPSRLNTKEWIVRKENQQDATI